MIRVLNFFCVALMGLTILGVYHVSEKTRVARMELNHVGRQIVEQKSAIAVLQTEWQHVASPARIQALAESRLGMSDTTSVQLSSFDLLPRKGDTPAPLGDARLHNASAQLPAPTPPVGAVAVPVSDQPGL